jgi:hypothetical protein
VLLEVADVELGCYLAGTPVVADAELRADEDGHVSLVDALLVVRVAQAVACRRRGERGAQVQQSGSRYMHA